MRRFKVEFIVSDEGLVTEEEAIAVLLESMPRQLTHECDQSNDRLFPEEITGLAVTYIGE